MTRYIGLLRGINVGGNKKIKMADLRTMLGELGFGNVKTALASGNAAWDADGHSVEAMEQMIASGIAETFGFDVPVIVFPQALVKQLVADDPFEGITVTEDTRLYVTFLPAPAPVDFVTPHQEPGSGMTILSVTDTSVCSVISLNETRTVDAMKVLESHFGKMITTRTWKTVLKIAVL